MVVGKQEGKLNSGVRNVGAKGHYFPTYPCQVGMHVHSESIDATIYPRDYFIQSFLTILSFTAQSPL